MPGILRPLIHNMFSPFRKHARRPFLTRYQMPKKEGEMRVTSPRATDQLHAPARCWRETPTAVIGDNVRRRSHDECHRQRIVSAILAKNMASNCRVVMWRSFCT
jgi:hypothetical protein